jgi:hypothetical protein
MLKMKSLEFGSITHRNVKKLHIFLKGKYLICIYVPFNLILIGVMNLF